MKQMILKLLQTLKKQQDPKTVMNKCNLSLLLYYFNKYLPVLYVQLTSGKSVIVLLTCRQM